MHTNTVQKQKLLFSFHLNVLHVSGIKPQYIKFLQLWSDCYIINSTDVTIKMIDVGRIAHLLLFQFIKEWWKTEKTYFSNIKTQK